MNKSQIVLLTSIPVTLSILGLLNANKSIHIYKIANCVTLLLFETLATELILNSYGEEEVL